MKTIAELLSRDLSRKIEEIIQVDQADEQAVYAEIDEYIATDSIRDQYAQLLKAIAEAPSDPQRGHRRLGVRLLRLWQKLVRQEPRLCLPEQRTVHGPAVRHALQAADRRQASQRLARLHQCPVPHRGHLLRGRQGAGHPARSPSGSPS